MKVLFSLWIALALFLTSLHAQEPVGHAVAVMGSVTVQRAQTQQIESLTTNSAIFLNDTVITAADGLVKLLLRDESVLRISPSSEVAITAMIAGPGAEGESAVELLRGRIRAVIGNTLGANSSYSIETPVAVAGVRGTDFEVVHIEVDGEWRTGIRCYNGAVIFALGSLLNEQGVLVLPQQFSTATATLAPQPPQPISDEQSLIEQLGGFDAMLQGNPDVDVDALIDAQQVSVIVELLNADHFISVDRVIRALEQLQAQLLQHQADFGAPNDSQTEVITEPIQLKGTSLQFDVEIPFPETSDEDTGGQALVGG